MAKVTVQAATDLLAFLGIENPDQVVESLKAAGKIKTAGKKQSNLPAEHKALMGAFDAFVKLPENTALFDALKSKIVPSQKSFPVYDETGKATKDTDGKTIKHVVVGTKKYTDFSCYFKTDFYYGNEQIDGGKVIIDASGNKRLEVNGKTFALSASTPTAPENQSAPTVEATASAEPTQASAAPVAPVAPVVPTPPTPPVAPAQVAPVAPTIPA